MYTVDAVMTRRPEMRMIVNFHPSGVDLEENKISEGNLLDRSFGD